MHLREILILLFVWQNVLSMLTKKKTFFKDLSELANEESENGTPIGQKGHCDEEEGCPLIEPPERQQMVRGVGNEHILQWCDSYAAQRGEMGKGTAGKVRFIKVRINETENRVEIEAQVAEEEGTEAELCLCDEENGICEGPFEAIEKFGGRIEKNMQCIQFDYHSLTLNAQFKLNYNRSKNHQTERKINFRNWHIVNLLTENFEGTRRRLDREFFIRISYESEENKKTTRVWAVQKCVKFVMLQALHDAKL